MTNRCVMLTMATIQSPGIPEAKAPSLQENPNRHANNSTY